MAIRPVLFTQNVQIYLETSSLQRVNNVSKLPGILIDERWEKLGTNHNVNGFSIRSFLERSVVETANEYPCKKTLNNAGHIDAKLIDFSEISQKNPVKSAVFY